jgi:hypothetical protein
VGGVAGAKQDDGIGLALIPGVDMLNHGTEAEGVAKLELKDGKAVITSGKGDALNPKSQALHVCVFQGPHVRVPGASCACSRGLVCVFQGPHVRVPGASCASRACSRGLVCVFKSFLCILVFFDALIALS